MLKKLALSLVALLVSLLAAELVIRIAGAAPKIYLIQKGRFQLSKNPKIGYEPVPMAYRGEDLSFYDYQGASNSQGFRDVEHAVEKPPGVFRIVVIGDSIAAGLKVDRFEDTFPPVLQEILDARGAGGRQVEVISLAVSGYNTQQEVETLREKGLRYRPDLVLLAYSLSSREHVDGDILRTLLEAERQKGGVSQARSNPILMKSALYRFLRFRLAAPRKVEELPKKYLDIVARDTVAEYFGVLEGLAEQNDFEVLVAVFPRFTRKLAAAYPPHLAEKHAYAQGLAEKHGFAYLDLLGAFDACRKASPEPIEADNFHPSARGHRCAAEALAEKIGGEMMR